MERSEILLTPIGKIITPIDTILDGIPIQGRMAPDEVTTGWMEHFLNDRKSKRITTVKNEDE